MTSGSFFSRARSQGFLSSARAWRAPAGASPGPEARAQPVTRAAERSRMRFMSRSPVQSWDTASPLQHVRPDELHLLDADALEGPGFGRRDDPGPLLGDEERVAACGGAGAGVPGDGPAGLEQL